MKKLIFCCFVVILATASLFASPKEPLAKLGALEKTMILNHFATLPPSTYSVSRARGQGGKMVRKGVFANAPSFARGSKEGWIQKLTMHAKSKNWSLFGLVADEAMRDGISLNHIEDLATECFAKEILRASLATKRILALSSSIGISKSDLFRMALFIEAEIGSNKASLDTFFRTEQTGFSNPIEYKPETQTAIIHLMLPNKGIQYNEMHAILYDVFKPQILASYLTTEAFIAKKHLLKTLQNAPGLIQVFATLSQKDEEGQTIYALLCKSYRGGTLDRAISKKYRFSVRQKMQIALDLLTGLELLHDKNIAHANLKLANILVDYDKKGKRSSRTMCAAITGLEKIATITDPVSKSRAFQRDVLALGCILDALQTGKNTLTKEENHLKPNFKNSLAKYQKSRLKELLKKSKKDEEPTPEHRFDLLILNMLDPDTLERGSASYLCNIMRQIIHEYEEQLAKI